MNTLLTAPDVVTMSSLEMVEYINSMRKEGQSELRHKDFMVKVRKVLGDQPAKNFAGQYKAANGQMQPCYRFPKREACLMALSYSYELQAKVFDKMTELESVVNTQTPQSFSQALRLAAEQQEKIEQQQLLIEQQTPLVTLAKAVIAEDKLMAIRDAGKELDYPSAAFFKELERIGWIYRRHQYDNIKKHNPWLPAAEVQRKGYLVLKERLDANNRMRIQTMVTPEGMKKLASIFNSHV